MEKTTLLIQNYYTVYNYVKPLFSGFFLGGGSMRKGITLAILVLTLFNLNATDIIRTISVTGTGTMVMKPDTVVISTGVDSGDPDIGIALDHNSTTMGNIFDGLADLGISEEEIETSNYNVYLYKPYNDTDNKKEEYRVSNSIRIKIKKPELVDAVIDTLITLGANKINGVYFTFENDEKYQMELRTKAMADARSKAEFLASLENMEIYSVLSIAEQGADTYNLNRNYAYEMSPTMAKTNITSGTEDISVSYNVIYQIRSK